MKKKICLITPGHIASNPRLVKEAVALENAGYLVHVIFTQYVSYLMEEDFRILKIHPLWTFDVKDWTGLGTKSKYNRILSGIKQKASIQLYKIYAGNIVGKYIINRNYSWQLRVAKRCLADLYIAHNLGALPVAWAAAQASGALTGFDAEDFHRFESCDDPQDPDVKLKASVEDFYLPKCNHLTAASPLIAKEYQKIYNKHLISILNVFPKDKAPRHIITSTTSVKLFWFSQTIGEGRGIEEIISAMGIIKDQPFELHLLGNCNDKIKDFFATLAIHAGISTERIFYYLPISPDKMITFASQFDIGLATETGVPFNRDICLTNKIFTYIQSGLAVVASNTSAQKQLMRAYPEIGVLYQKSDIISLSKALSQYYICSEQLVKTKKFNNKLGESVLNWEVESLKYIVGVNLALNVRTINC